MSGTDMDNLQPWSIAVISSVTVLAFICVVLRLVSRYERKQSLWWDDYMIMFSMAWNFVVVGFIFAMIKEGMGLHATVVGMEKNVLIAKLLLIAEILYVYNLVWTKLSFLFMYYRIFHFPYFKRWAYIIGGFVIIWVICITFLFIFICVPVQKLWYPDIPGRCINQVGTWISNAASTIATDLAILILPIPQVWKLQLRKFEKIALTVAFGLGFFVIFASVYRFTVLFSYSSLDPSYTLAPTVGWTAIEMAVGIMSACLPTLRPALLFLARKVGVKGGVTGFIRGSSSKGMSRTSHSKNHSGATMVVDENSDNINHSRKASQRAFYRLPDDGESGEPRDGSRTPLDAKLRPDHGYVTTNVLGSRGETNSWSGDEVPLHSIRVQKDFNRTDH